MAAVYMRSGFCFLRETRRHIVLENKFTGLIVTIHKNEWWA
jgi:hypothetical protein